MADRPILMSGPLVLATLAGRKSQTRRVVTPGTSTAWSLDGTRQLGRAVWPRLDFAHVQPVPSSDAALIVSVAGTDIHVLVKPRVQSGDRLVVRERFAFPEVFDAFSPRKVTEQCTEAGYPKPWCPTWYHAGEQEPATDHVMGDFRERGRWRPGIHMPLWASRLPLGVDGLRVERVQDISEDDARAEGVEPWPHSPEQWDCAHTFRFGDAPHKGSFCVLWDEINAARPGCAWIDNPFVWCISYHVET